MGTENLPGHFEGQISEFPNISGISGKIGHRDGELSEHDAGDEHRQLGGSLNRFARDKSDRPSPTARGPQIR
jgi:hypothetical protein